MKKLVTLTLRRHLLLVAIGIVCLVAVFPTALFSEQTMAGTSITSQVSNSSAKDSSGCVVCGDANNDGGLDISDGVSLVQYFFAGGPAPDSCADLDNCGGVTLADFVKLHRTIKYLLPVPTECGDSAACPTIAAGEVKINCWPVERYPSGDSFAVPVRITTVAGVTGLSIPLSYSGNFAISSINFTGSQVITDGILARFDTAAKKINVFAFLLGLDPQVYNNALLCKLNVRSLDGDPPASLDFDTAYYAPGGDWMFMTDQTPYYKPTFTHVACCTSCGDANSDGMIDISDAVYLLQAIFTESPGDWWCNYEYGRGDANGDGGVDISDVVYLIQYIFSGGPAPHCMGL